MKVVINGLTYKISWRHTNNSLGEIVNTYGRPISSATNCLIEISDGISLHGRSVVHPEDQFNKKVGRQKSFGRAISTIRDKSVRTALWDAYHEHFKKPIIEISVMTTSFEFDKDGRRYRVVFNKNLTDNL